ncbi:MAG: hypothetical protein MRZ79_27555 [Bacteroidia bacterium]|nr:hypothetical protein [Bacteroidia bacterium]
MKKILIVNGEKYWQEFFPGFEVVQKSIQHSSWILRDGALFVADAEGVIQPDGILWRVGAIKPSAIQQNALNLIDLANIPCVNSPQCLRLGYDRLSMLARMKRLGLPVIDFSVATKAVHLKNLKRSFPFVVKVGNYHGGFGKVLIEDEKKWQDIQDLLFITEDYISTEPYIPYLRDIRYLAIKDQIWAMSRRGKFWKANVQTTDYKPLEPDAELSGSFMKLKKKIGADILAIDILEDETGKYHILEYNDIPGLSGFPDRLKEMLASVLKEQL